MKKITIIMMLVLTGMVAMAQTSVWNGGKALWTRGTGTESDPYLLETADHLAFFAYMVNKGYNTSGMYFRLTTDVDLNGSEDLQWLPIGLGSRWFSEDGCDRENSAYDNNSVYKDALPCFKGHFDGGNHCISNIYVEGESNAGLFGAILSMSGDTVVIENVFVVSGTIAGATCGGIVANGQSADLVVSHCWNGASINGNTAGGIVGSGSTGFTQVMNCYNIGYVTGNRVGGIVGEEANLIEECYNNGTIIGSESGFAGGIVGLGYRTEMAINNCYNSGAVSAMGVDSGSYLGAGGLIGYGKNSTITNSYNVGEVSSSNHQGCLIGYSYGTLTIENAHYLNTCDQSEIGESQSESMMRSQEFVDLLNSQNPEPVWALDAYNLNDGFPVFAKNVSMVEVTANPADGGIVEGGGAYCFGSSVTLTATANESYTFINWTKDGEEVSPDPTYSFNVAASCSYVANFILNNYEVTVEANPAEGGVVTGAGLYQHGASATVTVIPNPEYQLNYWSKDGETVSEELSYTFIVTDDCQLVAHLIPSDVNEWGAAALKVYPNPTQGTFTVEGTGRMTVTNLLGQTVLSRDVEGQTIVELPQGTYFVKLDGITQKVVVK